MISKRPTLFLICGLPCSGKTTLAKKIEDERNALRLTPDEWMQKIVGDGFDETRRAAVESIMVSIAERCLSLGINVILDFGFWSRVERDEIRKKAKTLGAHSELHYLDTPMAELLIRRTERGESIPRDTFPFTEEQLKLWASLFEAPDDEELSIR